MRNERVGGANEIASFAYIHGGFSMLLLYDAH